MIKYGDMSNGYSQRRTEVLLRWVGSKKRVLDLGCFDGRDSVLLKNQENDVYGVDITPGPLRKASKRGIKTFLLNIENEKWPFEKNFFDVVIAGELIEHLLDPDEFLENARRVLKPHGLLIITTPNLASLGRRLLLLLGKNPFIEISKYESINGFPAVGHVKYFVKNSLLKLIKYHKFDVEELLSDGICLGPITLHIFDRMFPTLGWRFILKARKRLR